MTFPNQTNSNTDYVLCAVVTDPEDPKFDLEKLILRWEKDAQ